MCTSSDCSDRDLQHVESRLVLLLRVKRWRKLPVFESSGDPFKERQLDDKLIVSRSDVLQLGATSKDIELYGLRKFGFLAFIPGVENDPTYIAKITRSIKNGIGKWQ